VADEFRKARILLVHDIILNHTSDEHAWAQKAKAGETHYQDYYYIFRRSADSRYLRAKHAAGVPWNRSGNFTWSGEMQRWVMSVFHHYQWEPELLNPEVLIQIVDIILFWANQGVDVLRP